MGQKGRMMSQLPLQPKVDGYSGSDVRKLRKAREHNELARNVVDYLHRKLAHLPNGVHQFLWADIAHEMELSTDQVRSTVRYEGHNGITIKVIEDHRTFLNRFM